MLLTSNRLTVIGTCLLAVAIACSMFLIADVLFGVTAATVTAVATLIVIGSLWYALPISRRRGGSNREAPTGERASGLWGSI